MLLSKPEGMCTVSSDTVRRTVTLGFHTHQNALAFWNQAVDRVIETTQGASAAKESRLNFTEEERESALAQTMIDTIDGLRKQANTLRSVQQNELAAILDARATCIENDINNYLNAHRAEKS
jgi:hypothetical protein